MRGAVIALTAVIVGVSVRTADASFGTRDQIPAPTDVENVIQVWLECDECTGGELQAVVTLGPKAVPILASMLQKGPAKERLDAQRKHLLKRYGSLRDYQKTHSDARVTESEDEFVGRYMNKYETLQRIRAARALGAIGGADARNALDQALKLPLSPEVLKAVKESRAKIAG